MERNGGPRDLLRRKEKNTLEMRQVRALLHSRKEKRAVESIHRPVCRRDLEG